MAWVPVLGWVLAAGATMTVAPQLLRLLRTGSVDGVSLSTGRLATLTMVCWSWYSVQVGDVPALASSLGPLVVWLLISARVGSSPGEVLLTVLVAALAVPVGLLGLAHVVAVVGSMIWALPQLRTVYRFPSAPGVSTLAFFLLAAENAGWVAYALGTGHLPFMVAPLVQGPAALVICLKVLRARRRSAPVVEVPDQNALPSGCAVSCR